jgi:hypothetical protein
VHTPLPNFESAWKRTSSPAVEHPAQLLEQVCQHPHSPACFQINTQIEVLAVNEQALAKAGQKVKVVIISRCSLLGCKFGSARNLPLLANPTFSFIFHGLQRMLTAGKNFGCPHQPNVVLHLHPPGNFNK